MMILFAQMEEEKVRRKEVARVKEGGDKERD